MSAVQNMKQKILFLDDNEEFVTMMAENFTENYECFTYVDPKEALKKLRADQQICLVISDYVMPLINGSEFLKLLRADGNLVPIIFVTGELDQDLALNALRMGAAGLLEKPISVQELEEAINRVLYIETRKKNYYTALSEEKPFVPDKILGLMFVKMAESAKKKTS